MKRLIIDIETTAHRGRFWGLWQQNIGLNQLEDVTYMISFAAKWYGERKTFFYSTYDDGQEVMVKAARDLLDEAHVVVHYNGERFDRLHINREIEEQRGRTGDILGFAPPSPYQQIDVLKAAMKREFKLPSNKLDYVLRWLGLEGKVQHQGFGLWDAVEKGDAAARRLFRKYNIGDVVQLEKAYDRIKVWIANHPNMQLFVPPNAVDDKGNSIVTEDVCVLCGSENTIENGTNPRGRLSRVQGYQCQDCGRVFSGKRSLQIASGR